MIFFKFFIVNDRCSKSHRVIKEPVYISSPGYPTKPYPNDAKCIWDFTNDKAPNLLTFKLIDLETEVESDFIEVRNENKDGFILKSFSGSSLSGAVTTTMDSKMWVKFQSDFETNGKGFQAVVYPGMGCFENNYFISILKLSKSLYKIQSQGISYSKVFFKNELNILFEIILGGF